MQRLIVFLTAVAFAAGMLGVGSGVAAVPAMAAAGTGVVVDPGFVPTGGVSGSIEALVVQSDGKTIVGGQFEAVNGVARTSLARINADGSLDASFNPGSGPVVVDGAEQRPGTVSSLALQADGKVIVGGWFDTFNGVARATVVRLNTNGSVDPTFNAGTGARSGELSGTVQVVAVAADGKVLVGGSFDSFNGAARRGITRLTTAGAVDATFNPGTGFGGGEVVTLAIAANGTVVAGGDFADFNGVARPGLARLLANGGLDAGFAPGAGPSIDIVGVPYSGRVAAVALWADGKVLVGGWFTAFGGVARTSLAQLNSNGTVDGSFGGETGVEAEGYVPWVNALRLQADGKVLVGGDFEGFLGVGRPGLLRLTAAGALDGTFTPSGGGPAGGSSVTEVFVQSDAKVLAVGDFEGFGGAVRTGLARTSATGVLDAAYAPLVTSGRGFNGEVTAVVTQPDGKLLVGGAFTSYNGSPRRGIARLNADGTLDATFNPGGGTTSVLDNSPGVITMLRQPDGKILVGGWFTEFDGIARNGVLRLLADGTLDPGFDPGAGVAGLWEGYGFVHTFALQPDGKVLMGGWFTSVDGVGRNGIARLNTDGTLDATFDPGSGFMGPEYQAPVGKVLVAPDGKILVGGSFETANGVSRRGIARLNLDGSLDASFNPGTGVVADAMDSTGSVKSLALQPDGRVLVGGDFVSINGVARGSFARLNSNGSVDPSFASGAGFANSAFSAVVWSVVTQPDGTILVGGDFDSYGGTARRGLVRLLADGSLDATFVADLGSVQPARSVAVQADGKIVVGGRFAGFGDTFPTPINIMRLVPQTPAAPVASAFVPIAPARVLDTRVSSGGKGPLAAGEARVYSVATAQSGGQLAVPAGAVAIAYNLTVPNPDAGGHVRLMPGDVATLTSASAINFRPGETIANAATVKIDAQRRVKVYAAAAADVIIDVVGYFVPATQVSGGRFTPVTPVRVYDSDKDPAGLLRPGASKLVSTATVQSGSGAVVPAGASAVAYNLTVVRPDRGPGHLRVMPGDVASTASSAINWGRSGDVIANGSTVQVDSQRRIRVFSGSEVPVRFLLDVVGYYGGGGAQFFPIDPARVSDSRVGYGGAGPIASVDAGVRVVPVAATQAGGAQVVPTGATAIAFNLTATGTGSGGHLRVFPAGSPLVDASTLNWPGAGYTRANGTVVGISPTREIKLYNGSGDPVEAVVDVLGYYR